MARPGGLWDSLGWFAQLVDRDLQVGAAGVAGPKGVDLGVDRLVVGRTPTSEVQKVLEQAREVAEQIRWEVEQERAALHSERE